jgi:uncharacterized protein
MAASSRVVIDTNVWVSYFIGGRSSELAHLILDNDLVVLTSKELVDELTEVLGRKKFGKYLTLPVSEYVSIHLDLTSPVGTVAKFDESPDPKDNFLFDIALQHRARYLVTGDRKLLAMQRVKPVEVVSLTTFRGLLKD